MSIPPSESSRSDPPGGDDSVIQEVRLRRAPRLPVFLILGAILGAIVTLVVTASQPADPKIGFAASYGYFCVFGVPAGIAFGALVGLVLDRLSVRRALVVNAEHEQIDGPSDADLPDDTPLAQ